MTSELTWRRAPDDLWPQHEERRDSIELLILPPGFTFLADTAAVKAVDPRANRLSPAANQRVEPHFMRDKKRAPWSGALKITLDGGGWGDAALSGKGRIAC